MHKLLIVLMLSIHSGLFAQSYAAATRVEVLPDDAGTVGELRFREAWGAGGHYLAFKTPAALAGNVTWTLPSTDGTSGQALVTNGSGVLSWAAGGGGSSYYQTMRTFAGADLPQRAALRATAPAINIYDDPDGADGDAQAETEIALFTSPANASVLVGTGRVLTTTAPLTIGGGASADLSADRALACVACVTTDTTQTITGAKTIQQTLTTRTVTPEAGNTYSLGTYGGFGADGSYQFAHIRNVRSSQLAVGVWDVLGFTGYHRWEPGTLNQSQIKDSSGVSVLGFNSNVSPDMVTVYGSLTVNSALAVTSTSTFASAATFNGGLVMPSGTNNTIRAGSGGALYVTPRGLASAAVSCGGVADGWTEITTDAYLVQCLGGSRYRLALVGY